MVWYSRHPCPGAEACNALEQSWTGLFVYAFPPFNLIRGTLIEIRADKVETAIVVLPNWPKMQWYNILQELRCECTFRFLQG